MKEEIKYDFGKILIFSGLILLPSSLLLFIHDDIWLLVPTSLIIMFIGCCIIDSIDIKKKYYPNSH